MTNSVNLSAFGVSSNTRFSCLAMSTNVSGELVDPFPIGSGLYAFFSSPFERNELWTETLGTDHDERLSSSNLFLVAFSNQRAHPALARPVSMVLYALLIQGRAYSVDGLRFGGYNAGEGLHLDATGYLDDFFPPPKVIPYAVDVDSLRRSSDIAAGIATIFRSDADDHYLRLRKGFNSFLSGIKEGISADARLHHFVRAVEAVIKPDIRGTGDQFVHRGQCFAGRSDPARGLLRQLFNMRSAAEHLNPMKNVLNDCDARARDNLVSVRTYQAELLAGHVYTRLLTDLTLLEEFRTDDQISALWRKLDHELKALWGQPIDLERAIEGRFHDFYNGL